MASSTDWNAWKKQQEEFFWRYRQQEVRDWVPKTMQPEETGGIELKTPVLLSLAKEIPYYCEEYNSTYLDCREKMNDERIYDPRKCLPAGKNSTQCAVNLALLLNSQCKESFKAHSACLKKYKHRYGMCKEEEEKVRQCSAQKVAPIVEQVTMHKPLPEDIVSNGSTNATPSPAH